MRPAAAELDAQPRFPRELFDKVGALGFFGMRYPAPDVGTNAQMMGWMIRITSYNVCYTKLLRWCAALANPSPSGPVYRLVPRSAHPSNSDLAPIASAPCASRASGRVTMRTTVITSYSIHYTKLYET